MKDKLLAWIKANPVTLASIVVAIGSIVFLLAINIQGHSFVEQMGKRKADIRRIKNLLHTTVHVPPAKPDDPEQEHQIAVNQAAIDDLTAVYDRMNQEYTQVFQLAVQLNQQDHAPLDEGLFPDPIGAHKVFEARQMYRRALTQMLLPFDPNARYPRLNAKPAPTSKSIADQLAQVQKNFLSANFLGARTVEDLTPAQVISLNQHKKRRLREFLRDHARSIHMYAQNNITSPQFPFDVGQWSQPDGKPQLSDVWEGQVGLWIQQDIAQAIAHTNLVDDENTNVINAPIKRLVSIKVVPGYVGLHGVRGAVVGKLARSNRSRTPQTQTTVSPGNADTRLPNAFEISPTGRQSNPIYDVRHVWLTVVMDSQQMPVFFENLQQVNFMTILQIQTTDIDEYEQLRHGYFYGSGDSVQLKMLIESIWLRDWTTALMPKTVRHWLGIQDPPDPQASVNAPPKNTHNPS